MAEQPTLPWVTEGAKVAIYRLGAFGSSATITTISRLTATQVVCANGSRFHRFKFRHGYGATDQGLQAVGDSWGDQLLPADDKRVLSCVAQGRYHRFQGEVEKIFKARPGRNDIDTMLASLADIVRHASATAEKLTAIKKEMADGGHDQ